jgi:hypothetical protein
MGDWMSPRSGLECLKKSVCHTIKYSYKIYGLGHFCLINTADLGLSFKEDMNRTRPKSIGHCNGITRQQTYQKTK